MSQPTQEWWTSIQDLPASEEVQSGLKLDKEAVSSIGEQAMKDSGDTAQYELCIDIAGGFAMFADAAGSPAEVEHLAGEDSRRKYAAGGGRSLTTGFTPPSRYEHRAITPPSEPGYTPVEAVLALDKIRYRFFAVVVAAAKAQLIATPVQGIAFHRSQSSEDINKGLVRLAGRSAAGDNLLREAEHVWGELWKLNARIENVDMDVDVRLGLIKQAV